MSDGAVFLWAIGILFIGCPIGVGIMTFLMGVAARLAEGGKSE